MKIALGKFFLKLSLSYFLLTCRFLEIRHTLNNMTQLYSEIPLAQNIIELCKSKNISDVVISPGSRNAPLTISFTNQDFFNTYSIVDERSAGFFALGMAQQTQKPVVLCCTSGSALVNYYPAIVEAFYSDIPLIVISADRPVERLEIGDGQTIRQKNVFQNHILYSANLYSEIVLEETPTDKKLIQKKWEAQKHNEREINLALNTAIEKTGPVHINVPFYEPLYHTTKSLKVSPLQIEPIREKKSISEQSLKPYADIWNNSKKKLVMVGVNKPSSIEKEYLEYLAKDPSVLVFTETTSNLHEDDFILRIDNLIAPIEISENPDRLFKELQPDILLTLGGMVVSKKVKAFLRNYQPTHHWHIDSKKALNTYFCLNKHFDVEHNNFFSVFKNFTHHVSGDYRKKWLNFSNQRNERHDLYMENIPFSDLKVFSNIFKMMKDPQVLHVSNSSVVRYANLFKLSDTLEVYCNRGTSGIDGSVSTAVGAAVKSEKPTTLITGDLAFFYDSTGLWHNYIPRDFKIILITNGGGGIIRILPGNKNEEYFHKYFETRHHLNAEPISRMFGFSYQRADSEEELLPALKRFFEKSDQPQILEIFTPTEVNDEILLNYFKFIRE